MSKKINKTIMKRPQGFTLVETLLVVFFTSFTIMGVYMMQRKASDEVTVSKEKEYILTLFDQMDKTAASISRFQNVSLQTLKDNGYEIKTNGFNLAAISTPTATRVEAEYSGLTNKECSMFVSSMVNFSDNHSARINNIPIASKSNPAIITRECSNDANNVVIIRENNMFGVALNTSLNGINNPMIGQNINTCPVGVCNTMTPVTPVPFTPLTVTVNKPTVTIPGAITTPTFTPGTPMVQPPVVPPVVTPPPPPPPPVVTPPPPPPVVTPPAGPTTPVTPPPPPAIPKSIPEKGNIVWGSTPSWEPMSGESQVVSKDQNGIVWYIPMGNGYIGALMGCPYGYTPEIISWTGNGVTVPAQCNKT